MKNVDRPELPLKVVIDTNVFIAAENIGASPDVHSHYAAEFIRLAGQLHVQIVISQGTQADIFVASGVLRAQRQRQLQRYSVLEPVVLDLELARQAEFPDSLSGNDRADLEVLQALAAGAADWLVTQDINLRKRAARAGYGDRVFGLEDVIETFGFYLNKPAAIPGIRTAKGYQFYLSASIFDDLRQDYDGFEEWWRSKVALEHRDVLTIGSPEDPQGISVLKPESDEPYGLPAVTLKVCTFKVAEPYSGARRGELLLKATIDYARRNRFNALYLEVFPDKQRLTSWLEGFGFKRVCGATTKKGEYVYVKHLLPDSNVVLPALAHNVAYGPGSLRVQSPHFVPVQPQFHGRLFPEAEPQLSLFTGQDACGNAIGKAYLSHTPIRRLKPGDTLLFVRTGGNSAATVVGVVESTFVSSEADAVLSFVGNRTVYSVEEVRQLCHAGDVLAIRFRLDRINSPPWKVNELQAVGALLGSPQSIQKAREEGLAWIHRQLGE